MEKHLFNNSISLQLHLKPSHSHPSRIRHVDFRLPSSLLSLESRSVNSSFSFKCLHDSSSSSSCSSALIGSPKWISQARLSRVISPAKQVLFCKYHSSSCQPCLLCSSIRSLFHQLLLVFKLLLRLEGQLLSSTGSRFVRNELLSSAWTGFFAGCLHTLSGPDHLAALAPLSIGRTRMESAAVGALWGCGHDAGQLIFGLLFLLLKDRLHIEVIRTWGTRVVGFTLLVIGALGIKEASEVHSPIVALEMLIASACCPFSVGWCCLPGYVLGWNCYGNGKLYCVYRLM
ncbi:hypothetical protein HAX54_005969 [Datura stramonium]|uniref:Urease accessory protein UreH-like transmembrane domain-containing protein n=1 Tax=Datura stramonium TaxID=4076 RepID=A0ABS8RI87_DATST|nr:hypothetical protein [Datura stramonium]